MIDIVMYGADWCPDCRRAKVFLRENDIDFSFIDVDLDKEATARVEAINHAGLDDHSFRPDQLNIN